MAFILQLSGSPLHFSLAVASNKLVGSELLLFQASGKQLPSGANRRRSRAVARGQESLHLTSEHTAWVLFRSFCLPCALVEVLVNSSFPIINITESLRLHVQNQSWVKWTVRERFVVLTNFSVYPCCVVVYS